MMPQIVVDKKSCKLLAEVTSVILEIKGKVNDMNGKLDKHIEGHEGMKNGSEK